MSRVREITLIFFVTYLPPLKPRLLQPKLNFGRVFLKICLLKCVGSPKVYLFIDLLLIHVYISNVNTCVYFECISVKERLCIFTW